VIKKTLFLPPPPLPQACAKAPNIEDIWGAMAKAPSGEGGGLGGWRAILF